MMNTPVAFVLKGYPRLSETFIAQEILALEQQGLDIRLYSLRHPTDATRHPIHDEIKAVPNYLPEYLYQAPMRLVKAWMSVRLKPGYKAVRAIWFKDLWRDRTVNRVRRIGQAIILADELPDEVRHIHAHFLHTPASVARYAARILDIPWSCSAHAKDIWTSPEWELREKLKDCKWLVTCTKFNAEFLAQLSTDPTRVELVYHGLDFSRFTPPKHLANGQDGSNAENPVHLICVGRAVAKKGHARLLEALTLLPQDLHWTLDLIGGGELIEPLKQQATRHGLADRIVWSGALAQQDVLVRYQNADLFVLNSLVTGNGDRDGLPNVLMEAQSQRLACLSTQISAIPELIEQDVTGVLVPSEDNQALATALEKLIRNPQLRQRLGQAGFDRVHDQFDFKGGVGQLMHRFQGAPNSFQNVAE
ncbi:MAG: glycosyltransferase family 4 protein [Magnetovibrio sp.]|nr:glycosyltransferase family 4 protein [Magnetovibrio sp.]